MIGRDVVRWILCLLMLATSGCLLAGGLPGESLYQIRAEWLSQEGKNIHLEEFRGHPVVLSLVYLSCEFTCPTIVSEIESLLLKVDATTREHPRGVLMSFAPRRDSPKVMKAYLKKRGLPESRWSLVTNRNESKIREIAAALNFKYQKDPRGEFTHSFMIAALDRDGVLKSRLDGANRDKSAMVAVLDSEVQH